MKRNQMPDNFIVPILSCTCLEVVEIDGARNIVWQDDNTGTVYHQDCTTPHPAGIGSCYVYVVSE